MSKVIYICFKNDSQKSELRNKITCISKRLLADNINPPCSKVVEGDNIIYSIINPVSSVISNSESVLLGKIYGDEKNWDIPGKSCPDGSYAIFRSDSNVVEIVSDVVASRSIWYYKDDEIFISSTSQRAIINFLGNLEFNQSILPWMMSTGSLGPANSWDNRIKCVEPDSSIILDRSSWQIIENTKQIEFKAPSSDDKELERLLTSAYADTFRSLRLDFKKWILPLSGGYDSRGILCFLKYVGKNLNDLKTITWGLNNSRTQKGNDAYVAKKLANHFKLENKYYSTDLTDASFELIIDRFLACGEGRIDHIGGYLDGFNVWKILFESGVEGIIRGDISFSSKPAKSSFLVRKLQGISLCSDYSNLKNYEDYGFERQEVPKNLLQHKNESLAGWRDRLYHQFRMPVILSALNDLKVGYVEVINPLLSRKIVYQTRNLPDNLRTNKTIFKKIVHSISPAIPMATSNATEDIAQILKKQQIVKIFIEELSSEFSKNLFPSKFIEYVLSNIKTKEYSNVRPWKNFLKRFIPRWIINGVPKSSQNNLDFNILAFRMYLVCKMNKLILQDFAELNEEFTNHHLSPSSASSLT